MQPYISDWQQKYNLALVIVSSDRQEEMSKFVSKNHIAGQVLLDSQGSVSQKYKIRTIPSAFMFEGKGQLQESFVGWRGSSSIKQIEARLQNM